MAPYSHARPKRSLILTFLVLINVGILLGIGFLVYKNLGSQTASQNISNSNDSEIIAKISKLVTIDQSQTPQVLALSNIDKVKASNAIQADVYKDAQNGDYILNYGDTMIIYRDSENKIIYNGDTPTKIISDTQKKIIDKITQLVKDKNLLKTDDTETAQLSPITDAILAKKSTSTFYKDSNKEDIIGVFPTNQIIVIYRPSTESLVITGTYETVIHPN